MELFMSGGAIGCYSAQMGDTSTTTNKMDDRILPSVVSRIYIERTEGENQRKYKRKHKVKHKL